ncbi:uncharacterized protein LOC107969552 [Pan troglodytes]|uniref:uncharacterized protein LOC107969552 n=1 Tax=Pan troglodytes TaxID=9598 RepID=UPI0030138043
MRRNAPRLTAQVKGVHRGSVSLCPYPGVSVSYVKISSESRFSSLFISRPALWRQPQGPIPPAVQTKGAGDSRRNGAPNPLLLWKYRSPGSQPLSPQNPGIQTRSQSSCPMWVCGARNSIHDHSVTVYAQGSHPDSVPPEAGPTREALLWSLAAKAIHDASHYLPANGHSAFYLPGPLRTLCLVGGAHSPTRTAIGFRRRQSLPGPVSRPIDPEPEGSESWSTPQRPEWAREGTGSPSLAGYSKKAASARKPSPGPNQLTPQPWTTQLPEL